MEAPRVAKGLLSVPLRSALVLVLALGPVACQDEITGPNETLVQVEIVAPDTAAAGSNFEVRIQVSNVGRSIRNARISALLPAPLTIVSVGPSAGTTATFSNAQTVSVITWDLGTMDTNSQAHLVVNVVGVLEAAEANRAVTIEARLTAQGLGGSGTAASYNIVISSALPGATPVATRTPTQPGTTATATPPGATATQTRTRTPTLPGPTATSTPPGPTFTPTLPGATATATPPVPTATSTPPGPTATPTPTLPGPTATFTPPPPTATPTLPGPTATRTPTLPGPTATFTPPPPTATPTPPPTATSTPPPPTATPTPPPTATSTPPAPTATPTLPAPTATPTPPPTATPTPGATIVVPLIVRQFVWEFPGGGNSYQMQVGQTYQVVMTNTDPPGEDEHGFSGIPALGMSGAVLDPGDVVIRMVSPTSPGIHAFSCSEDGCGDQDEHDNMLGVIQVVP